MTEFVKGDTVLNAWQQGVDLLLQKRGSEVFNLVTTIGQPTILEQSWFNDFNPAALCGKKAASLSGVANTIFPRKYLDCTGSREMLYGRYLAAHQRKSLHKSSASWGTYFERMISFGDNQSNQLESVIEKLNEWKHNHKSALYIHLSAADVDSPQIMGAPCLQYLGVLCPDPRTVSLLAVYRNHDFFSKALGNFIGLGQLLQFIGRETNRKPDWLTCHSAHADFGGARMSDVRKLRDGLK